MHSPTLTDHHGGIREGLAETAGVEGARRRLTKRTCESAVHPEQCLGPAALALPPATPARPA